MDIKSAVKFSTGLLNIRQLTRYSYKKLIVHHMMGKTDVSIAEANCFRSWNKKHYGALLKFCCNFVLHV